MEAVIGVNDISIKFAKTNNIPLIIGPYPKHIEEMKHINESITFPSVENLLIGITKLYNFTFNILTSFVIEEICFDKKIKLVSTLPFRDGIIVKFSKPNNCLRCAIEESKKEISNYLIFLDKLNEVGEGKIFRSIKISMDNEKDFFINQEKEEEITNTCECDNSKKYSNYEYGEMINPDCGHGSSGVFPIDDRHLDIKKFSELLKRHNINILLENESYINFEAENKKLFLFENGRVMISDLRDKIEIEYLYRKYIGN